MADWFVGPVMDKLISAFSDYLQDQYFRGRTGMKEELERLRVNHPLIQSVVSAYTQGNITDLNLKSWFWLLRDAIDEANDVLDDFEYMKHKEQLELNMEETKVPSSFDRFILGPARKLGRVCGQALKRDPNLEKLEGAVQKLDSVSAQVHNFLHLVEKKEKEQQGKDQQLYVDRESGSIPGPVFIGRDQEKEFVMKWLRKPSNHNLSLLSIVGHGGMGKTALLQNIYADEIAKEFDLKIWVCVSNDFEVEEVITDMLKYLHKWSSHLTKLPPLQETLNSLTRSKKFLLVLDDIWEEKTTKWEKVFSPLANGNLGSKILVTTRTHAASSIIPGVIIEKETLILEGLKEAQCLELLETYAFDGKKNFKQYEKLKCIAKEIVKRLSRSPLAAKVIGGVLNSKLNDERAWTDNLNSTNALNVEQEPGRNSILPILKLGFSFLSHPQQNCFAFCGIFPQDHQFNKDDLVRMWIALGFIQESSIEGDTLEDIGRRYFDVLVRKSFFDDFHCYYKMHDLLHDLAKYISSEECFRFVGDDARSLKFPKTIRHLFVKTENQEVLRMIKDVKNLHSLFLTSNGYGQYFIEILTEIFEASRSIRLLFINSHWRGKMSETIENLKKLRYLNLTMSLTQMPRSLNSLYHLRFIIYKTGYRSVDFLFGDVSNLSNLRHLELPRFMFSIVPAIGKLRLLQELNEFNVKNENGYRIEELKHMSELRKLKIHFLENISNATEALNAKLFEKRKLTDLFLNWGETLDEWKPDRRVGSRFLRPWVDTWEMGVGSRRNFVNSELDVNLLENLKPYKKLKRLSIASYKGVSGAKWMYNEDLISNLEHICLNGCSEWETLPPFGQLPNLKSLYLRNMPKVKQLYNKFRGNNNICVFPALEVLHMEGLQVLEDWFDGAGAAADDCFFPCLTELFLVKCPNLQELPYLPPKLKKMKIDNIGWKAALNCKQESNNCCGISKSIPLETFQVLSCPNITSLLSLGGLQHLEELCLEYLESLQCLPTSLSTISSLKDLYFDSIPLLKSLPDLPSSLNYLNINSLNNLECLPSSLSAISSLNSLRLCDIPLLKSLPDLPSSLKLLSLHALGNLQCLPSSLSANSSLQHLVLDSIPLLKSLPDLPPSLCSLYTINCHPKLKKRYKKFSGSDWHKISHIPHVHIN